MAPSRRTGAGISRWKPSSASDSGAAAVPLWAAGGTVGVGAGADGAASGSGAAAVRSVPEPIGAKEPPSTTAAGGVDGEAATSADPVTGAGDVAGSGAASGSAAGPA